MTDDPLGRERLADVFGQQLEAYEMDGRVRGYTPVVDPDQLDTRTVVLRLAVATDAVAEIGDRLRRLGAVSVFEQTGTSNVLAVCRFPSSESRDACIAQLTRDPRIDRVSSATVLETVTEGDQRGLL